MPRMPYNGVVAFQALYRKYRPKNFAEVVGQRHVTQILRNSLKHGRVGHAYLFSGPRGTGKTSIARIFAKALNCPNLKDGDPCGDCEVCTAIADGAAPDVIEIDAASNRGIDDVRDLRERVQYAPARFKYKTYIIDEAHMITGPAFNALLKTLEEPPKHVVFILCTTEPHKLPLTILSRVMKFEFHLIPYKGLAEHLLKIAKAEKYELAEDAALLLAELAGGCVRDSISHLDQAMIYREKSLTRDDVEELFYLTSREHITDLVVAMVRRDVEKMDAAATELIASGKDPEWLLVEVAETLERFLLNRARLREAVEQRGHVFEPRPDQAFINAIGECWEAGNRLKREGNPALLFRITLYRVADGFAPVETGAGAPNAGVRNSLREGVPNLQPVTRGGSQTKGASKQARPRREAKKDEAHKGNEEPPARQGKEPAESARPPSEAAPDEEPVPLTEEDELKPAPEPDEQQAEDPGTPGLFNDKLHAALAENERRGASGSVVPAESVQEDTAGAESVGTGLAGDSRWKSALDDLRKESLATFCLIFEGPAATLSGDTLTVSYPHRLRYFAPLLQDAKHLRLVETMVKRHFGEQVETRVVAEGAGESTANDAEKTALETFPGSAPAELGE